MNRSRLLMIGGLALAVGLLVSFYVYNRLRTPAGSNSSERQVSVVVAASDIQVGAKLGMNDVRTITIPQSAAPPVYFTATSAVVGRGAIWPINKGEFILPIKLAALNAGAGLPSLIPQGMRAVSVRVNDVVSVAGFVQPGAHVDVLATGNNEGGGNERLTSTVLENVLVLAVGKNMDRNVSADAQTAPVITLALSPDDAQKLALVSQEGRIQLSLRNPMDTQPGGVGATRTSSLYPGATVASEPKPKVHKVAVKVTKSAPTPYAVEMIRGSKREENKFDQATPQ